MLLVDSVMTMVSVSPLLGLQVLPTDLQCNNDWVNDDDV
jgi:hypothetical protein